MKLNNWTSLITGLSVLALVACSPSGQAAETKGAVATKTTTRSLEAARQFSIATTETISSRTAQRGEPFSATVVWDVSDNTGRVAIPAGSRVDGTITDVSTARSSSSAGTLTLTVNHLTVRGKQYDLDATIDSLATERVARAVNAGDAIPVGVGAAAGAIVGQIVGKNPRGTIIGAAVGAAAGAGYAAATKDSDISLPNGTHIRVTLKRRLTVTAN
jgi:hypothetical protein